MFLRDARARNSSNVHPGRTKTVRKPSSSDAKPKASLCRGEIHYYYYCCLVKTTVRIFVSTLLARPAGLILYCIVMLFHRDMDTPT